jgi:hypothetical protein
MGKKIRPRCRNEECGRWMHHKGGKIRNGKRIMCNHCGAEHRVHIAKNGRVELELV